MRCDLWRRSMGKKCTRKYEGDYDDDSIVVVFPATRWWRWRWWCRRRWRGCMAGVARICERIEKKWNVWWQIDWSRVNEAKRPKERTTTAAAAWWRKKRARMVLMYYTQYIYWCCMWRQWRWTVVYIRVAET